MKAKNRIYNARCNKCGKECETVTLGIAADYNNGYESPVVYDCHDCKVRIFVTYDLLQVNISKSDYAEAHKDEAN